MEQIENMITLKEWAIKNGLNPATARQKAIRGMVPAVKFGNQWIIKADESNVDHRRKDKSK